MTREWLCRARLAATTPQRAHACQPCPTRHPPLPAGASGIVGSGIARQLLMEGARVVALLRREEQLDGLVKECQGGCPLAAGARSARQGQAVKGGRWGSTAAAPCALFIFNSVQAALLTIQQWLCAVCGAAGRPRRPPTYPPALRPPPAPQARRWSGCSRWWCPTCPRRTSALPLCGTWWRSTARSTTPSPALAPGGRAVRGAVRAGAVRPAVHAAR